MNNQTDTFSDSAPDEMPAKSDGRGDALAAFPESMRREAGANHGIARHRRMNGATIGVTVLAVLAVLYTMSVAKIIIVPIIVALILNLVLSPFLRRMHRSFHLPYPVSAVIILFAGVVLFLSAIVLLAKPASTWLDEAPTHFRTIEAKFRSVSKPLDQINEASRKLEDVTGNDDKSATRVVISSPSIAGTLLDTTGSLLVGMMITAGLLFFLLAGGDRFLEKIVHVMPTWKEKRRAVELTRHIQSSVSHYLSTITYINVGLGVVIGTAMALLGMPNPILWGVMAALLNFVPIIGATVGALVVFFVGLVTFDSLGHAAAAPLAYIAANAIEANFVTPSLIGRRMSLNPVMVVLSLTVWTWIWGVIGAVLAVPILAVMKIVAENFERSRPFAHLLENTRPTLPAPDTAEPEEPELPEESQALPEPVEPAVAINT